MNDYRMKKNLKIFSCLILFLAVIFLIGGGILGSFLKEAQTEAAENQISNKICLYKTHISKQFAADIQTLDTIKSFISFGETSASEALLKGLNESGNNRFIRMSLVYSNAEVYHATLNKEVTKEMFDDLAPELQTSLRKSCKGENAVSEIYYDEDLKKRVIVISVPIKKDDKILGVLAAYDDITDFQEIMEADTGEETYVHLIADDGTFLIRTKNGSFNEEAAESIFTMDISLPDENKVKSALENGENYYGMFEKNGKKYSIYFSPIEYHNWYLCSIMPFYSTETTLIKKLNYSTFVYAAIIIMGSSFLFYSFYTFRKSNRILEKIAYYDELTGLYNLHKFKEICEKETSGKSNFSIIILNVKKFQLINETFGEQRGDILLCHIASILLEETGKNEYCCREASDQFVLLIRDNDKNKIISRLQRIENRVKDCFAKSKNNYNIQLSVGICTDGKDYKKMLSNALWAMKKAKQSNKSYVFFDNQLQESIQLQNDIESAMHSALEQEEFKLFLQPKYDIVKNQIIGAEALVRWIKPDGSMIFPDQFIPLFEKNGFCAALDLYMLEKVCKQLREWMDKGYEVHPVSINQTKLLFYRTDYVDKICSIISKYRISPNQIILEILEGLAIEDIDTFNRCIDELHNKGFKVSLDDFGSGYSSLGNLNELSVDEIKLDRKFLRLLGDEGSTQKNNVIKKIISLVSSLEVEVIVEGVETPNHIEIMKSMNCNYAQGYYFSKPISSEKYESLLESTKK